MEQSYYAIIPATVRYDSDLVQGAKLLYGEITALANRRGYCFASNRYFAKLYDVSIPTIKRWIKLLVDKNYLRSEMIYQEGTKVIKERQLYINDTPKVGSKMNGVVSEMNRPSITDEPRGGITNDTDNNTRLNTTVNKKRGRAFEKPSLDEIGQYCKERSNGISPQQFFDFYESKGWMVGKTKMKDWKACIRTWENRQKAESNAPPEKKDYLTYDYTPEDFQNDLDTINVDGFEI